MKRKQPKSETRGPLFARDGSVAVDPKCCPSLHRALVKMAKRRREGWGKVIELRLAGESDAADRRARKLLGIVEPMPEERKAELKAWKEEHKNEIKERQQQKLKIKKRTLAMLGTSKAAKQVRRKA